MLSGFLIVSLASVRKKDISGKDIFPSEPLTEF